MGVKERRELEKQTRRNQILDAARNLLFSLGIENISISKIAKKAELGVGTIYFYYKNKEDIFIALQKEGVGILYERIKEISAQSLSQDQKLRQVALAYFDFTENQKEYFEVINYFLSAAKIVFEKDMKLQLDMSAHRILEIIQQIIVSGQKDGLFTEEDPEKFSIMFWGTMHGLVQFKKLEHTTLKNHDYKEIYDYSVTKAIQTIVIK